MGHGNPDENYNANKKYSDMEKALQELSLIHISELKKARIAIRAPEVKTNAQFL